MREMTQNKPEYRSVEYGWEYENQGWNEENVGNKGENEENCSENVDIETRMIEMGKNSKLIR